MFINFNKISNLIFNVSIENHFYLMPFIFVSVDIIFNKIKEILSGFFITGLLPVEIEQLLGCKSNLLRLYNKLCQRGNELRITENHRKTISFIIWRVESNLFCGFQDLKLQTDGQTDGQTNGQTNGQTYRHYSTLCL